MLLQTILNRVHKQRLFVYGKARLIESPILELEVDLGPRTNSRARCDEHMAAEDAVGSRFALKDQREMVNNHIGRVRDY